MEADRAPGMANPADRARRYANYRQGTLGQNTLTSAAENQPLDAKATISGFVSTPERGAAVIDLKAAYNKETRDYQRGAMLVRGAQTYAIIQDDIGVKGTQTLTWSMHTRAAVAVDGNKAILTQGNQTLTAVILSPAGATFTTEEAPEQLTPLTSLKGVNVLKTQLAGVSGDQRLTVAFALGNEPVQAPCCQSLTGCRNVDQGDRPNLRPQRRQAIEPGRREHLVQPTGLPQQRLHCHHLRWRGTAVKIAQQGSQPFHHRALCIAGEGQSAPHPSPSNQTLDTQPSTRFDSTLLSSGRLCRAPRRTTSARRS
jgi:hypothetical protein